jgi:acetyltransferase-like isoleucine patch superfamily enzyme/acyl carrier protein
LNVNVFDRWKTKLSLRAVRSVGSGAAVRGSPDIGGGGEIIIGNDFFLSSQPAPSHIFASPGARINIGDSVQISYGAAIAAQQSIEIGNHTALGPFVVIMDNDFHRVGDRNAAGAVAPVRIGSNVMIGARVTILRGAVIGDYSRIMSGSMVSGVVPEGACVGGVPARAVIEHEPEVGHPIDIATLVQNVLSLAERPLLTDGPEQISEWDSLGTLRILLTIEESLGVCLDAEEMRAVKTIGLLSEIVEGQLGRPARREIDIAGLVQLVLDLSERPQDRQGPEDFAAWDSLGTLRLLLAIEEKYGVALDAEKMRHVRTVGGLSQMVETELQAFK